MSNGREFSEEWLRVLRRRNASNSIQSRLDRFYLSSACLPQASDHLPVHLSDYDEVTLSLRLLEMQHLLHDLWAEGARVRSRIWQLQDGESPFGQFFRLEFSSRRASSIPAVRLPDGTVTLAPDDLCSEYRHFFALLFEAEAVSEGSRSFFLDGLSGAVSDGDSEQLGAPLCLEELTSALRSMRGGETPGQDGLPKEFYAQFWDLLGPDLLEVFGEAFQLRVLPASQRCGIVTLLDKSGDPLLPQNKRPISLLNTDYKILARSLCSRLSTVLPSVVSPFQTCGVKGRSVHHNLCLLRDLALYSQERSFSCLFISLDQQKAFDRVDWSFLFAVCRSLGLGPNFISWLRLLYTDIHSQVLANGNLSDPFPLRRGIRQGCPLSPLLYVLFIELARRLNSSGRARRSW